MIKRNSVLYQVVTDRFDNEQGNLHEAIGKPDYNARFGGFLGGTFKGIQRRLDYLQNLGIDHLLLSPVQDSPHYHGYDIRDPLAVNAQFGTKEDLQALIEDCHKREIGVMLDYVPTHVSSESPVFKEHVASEDERARDWLVFLSKLREDSPYRPYFEELVYKLTSGDSTRLKEVNSARYLGYFGREDSPLLNLANPDVEEHHRRVIYHWLREFGFDSLRLDSGFIQPKDFIKRIGEYVHTSFPNVEVVAEHWDFEVPPRSGDCHGFCDGEFDIKSMLWFNNMSDDTQNFFRNFSGHYYRSKDHLGDYKYIAGLGNHDLPRFRGGKNLQQMAAVLEFTLPAVPMIYYGEEIGMGQFNDGKDRIAQSRDPMRWDQHNNELYNYYRNLVKFRRGNSFDSFSMSDIQINDNGSFFTYRVRLGDKNFFVLLNREKREKPVKLDELFPTFKVDSFDIPSGMPVVFNAPESFTVGPESAYLFGEKQE